MFSDDDIAPAPGPRTEPSASPPRAFRSHPSNLPLPAPLVNHPAKAEVFLQLEGKPESEWFNGAAERPR